MPDMEEYTLEALRARNPAVNLDIELRNARSYVKKNRGLDAEVDLKWFAEHWLPRCGPKPELAKAKMPVEPSDWRNRCRALAQADDAPLDMDRGTWRYFADLEWRRLPENVQTFLASQTPGA